MAKKGTRPANATQQRTREEQWRRRITSAGGPVEGVASTPGSVTPYRSVASDETETITPATANNAGITTVTFAPSSAAASTASTATRSTSVPRTSANLGQRAGGAASAPSTSTPAGNLAAQRRAAAAARSARNRIANTGLSLEDEMHYVRSDVRRLIILTAICVVVLILLFFVIPR